jgi:hypothetical protein
MIIAQALTEQSTTAKHTKGTIYRQPSTGAVYVYVLASEAITQYQGCSFNSVYAALKITKTEADKLYGFGIAQSDIASASYGWLLITGPVTNYCSTINAPLKEVALYTSATAGALDDCSTSQTKIPGIFCSADGVCATAENTAVFITRVMGV